VPFELKVTFSVRADTLIPTVGNVHTSALLTWSDYPVTMAKTSILQVYPGPDIAWDNTADIALSAYGLIVSNGDAEVRVQSYILQKQFVGYETSGTFTDQGLHTSDDVQFRSVNIDDKYTLPANAPTIGGQVMVSDSADLSQPIWQTPVKRYGEISFVANLAPTAFAGSTTASKVIDGPYVQGMVSAFSLQWNRMRYDGVDSMPFRVVANVSVYKASSGSVCTASIFINGTAVTQSRQKNSGAVFYFSSQCLVMLEPGDLVDVRMTNDDGTDLIVIDFQMHVTEA
jgi:hypothetical protein